MKILKRGNKLDQIKKKLGREHKVQIGHFKSQGKHSSGLTYPDLMKLHHSGTGNGVGDIPARPILTHTVFRVEKNFKKVLSDLPEIFKGNTLTLKSINEFLLSAGEKIKEIEQGVFGSSPPLADNRPLTISIKGRNEPMVDTGELRDKVEVKLKK